MPSTACLLFSLLLLSKTSKLGIVRINERVIFQKMAVSFNNIGLMSILTINIKIMMIKYYASIPFPLIFEITNKTIRRPT